MMQGDGALRAAYEAALAWYLAQGVDEAVLENPVDRFAPVQAQPATILSTQAQPAPVISMQDARADGITPRPILGADGAKKEAATIAARAATLSELADAIAQFNGLAIRKTATQMVFADGNPRAHVMVIGDAPAAEDDRSGAAFSGDAGRLLDKILSSIGLSRTSDAPERAVYLTNVLNWRPPGSRSPTDGEMDVSLPFIARHIALVRPKIILFCGTSAAQLLLGVSGGFARLRQREHIYKMENIGQEEPQEVASFVTYHPMVLLKTPSQKKFVWADVLEIERKIKMFT